mgnify:CR=1 FL=1
MENLIRKQFGLNSGREIVMRWYRQFKNKPSVSMAMKLEDIVEGACADISEGDFDGQYQRGEVIK